VGIRSIGWTRLATAGALVLTLSLSLSVTSCGGGGNGDVTLTIGSRDFPEQVILGQIYAQALEDAGYAVKRHLDLGFNTERAWDELRRHYVSGYPDHANTVLETFFGTEPEDLPTDAQKAYEKAKSDLERKGLTAFPPTPFGLTHTVVMLRKAADKRGLRTVSDLQGKSEEMTMFGPSSCILQLDCLGGIDTYYGTAFARYENVEFPERYKVLEDGRADTAMLYTTDGRLAAEKDKFVILEEDKHILPAGNVIFVTTPKAVEEAGPDYEKTIVEVQKGLTLPVMQGLDAEVEIEKQAPAKVAAQYLKSIGFTE
jgi:glycine betaine/choline ABC-type transport system substrate-binding protein